MPSRMKVQVLIAVVAALLFMPGLGAVHLFDWDEINFAEIAREMLVTGDLLQPRMAYEPFHEKPPFFIWMQAASMAVFGVGEFGARFPNAVCGIITLLVLFRMGERLHGSIFGLLWVLAYVGSILPHLYFHSGIIDPWFNLFIFLGFDAFIRATREEAPPATGHGPRFAALCGLYLGLAVMTKGPVGVLIPGLACGVYAVSRFKWPTGWLRLQVVALGTLLATVSVWAVVDLLRNGPEFMIGFFWRQVALLTTEDAGHGGFVGYHFVVLLLGCFPASFFALHELLRPTRHAHALLNDQRRWMVVLFWVVLILFSLVKTKIVHYSSLCYFPLTYLAALRLERIWRGQGFGWPRYALGMVGMLVGVLVAALPFAAMHIDRFAYLFAADPFAMGNIEADVSWTGVELLAGLSLIGAMTAAHFLHARARYRAALIATFGGTVLFIWSTLFFFIRNIEGYSQRAAVEFFEDTADERCWRLTQGYKSYVPPFYGRIMEAQPPEDVVLRGAIDRPVYLSCKITHVQQVEAIGTFTELYRKNGFVFFVREPDPATAADRTPL
jgi:4-amino-4-deoxy-L-arabinose transferase-like glycosyltransferase